MKTKITVLFTILYLSIFAPELTQTVNSNTVDTDIKATLSEDDILVAGINHIKVKSK
jgi:hypothetical protein